MARPRRSEQQLDLQEAIKATAWKQIGEMGAAALSLRGIARELRITAPAIYNYYPSRDDLMEALVIDAFTSFGDALAAGRDSLPPADLVGRILTTGDAYYRWALAYPQRYMLIFGTPLHGFKMTAAVWEVSSRSFMTLVGVVGEAYRAGLLHLPDHYAEIPPQLEARYRALGALGIPYDPIVTQVALSMWGRVHGLTSLALYGLLPGFIGDQVDSFVRHELTAIMVFLGLR